MLKLFKSGKFIPAQENELQLDLDSRRDFTFFLHQWTTMKARAKAYGLKWDWRCKIRPSNSSKHFHVTIQLPEILPAIERIALQAILGSDRVREKMNYLRVKAQSRYPILFFRKTKRPKNNA